MPDSKSTKCQWPPGEKLALWTILLLHQKTITKHNARVYMYVMYLFIWLGCMHALWLGCTRETRHSSHSYSVTTAVHTALAAIAARAGFRGTALVIVQEPVP